MLFNSAVFVFLFLPITLVGFFALGARRPIAAVVWLVAASLFFYAWWNPAYLPLILFSMAFNFTVGRYLGRIVAERRGAPKRVLAAGIVVNLGLLFYFKYFDFFVTNVNAMFEAGWVFDRVVLPLAISFFTFQQITFLVDSYRGETREYRLYHYALFVVFFPQLIAGPIVHHSEMMPQFERPETFRPRADNLAIGASIFLTGLFKKVILADTAARYATPMFDAALSAGAVHAIEAWAGVLAYTFQLYFDFSGYSDMAIGLARMFGVTLPLNFASPYKSVDIVEFWRRWHMTLSRFLRDYLYIPLGGNRHGKARRYVNLMTTMLLGGLWHGAGWTFVAWGGLHGAYLVLNHAWRGAHARARGWARVFVRPLPRVVAVAVTFVAVVVAWVYFRAEAFGAANRIVAAMFGIGGLVLPEAYLAKGGAVAGALHGVGVSFVGPIRTFEGMTHVVLLVVLGVVAFGFPNTQEIFGRYRPGLGFATRDDAPRWQRALAWAPTGRAAWFVGAIGLWSLLSLTRVTEFLYFQF